MTAWVRRNAVPLGTIDPAAPLGDLEPLRRSIGGAEIVGLGESVHGTAEESLLKHRTLRVLVEQMGIRSIAWEEQWTVGLVLDDYIRGGAGDLTALVGQMAPAWQTREVAEVLRWLRDFNAGPGGPVLAKSPYQDPWPPQLRRRTPGLTLLQGSGNADGQARRRPQ